MPSFLMIRHAESHWSRDEMRPLSAAGRNAATRLATWLADPSIEAIYSSPYRRAVETAAPLAQVLGLPVTELHDLRERRLGVLSGLTFEEGVAATYSDLNFSHPGGESSIRAQRRALSVLQMLAARHPCRPIVVSTHGNLIALVLNHFSKRVGFEFWLSLTFPDVYRLQLSASGAGSFERLQGPAA